MAGYLGNVPVPQATMTFDKFTATAGQTSFATSGYTPNFLQVYLNGVHLVNGTDYTATNGSDVVLTSGAADGDVLEVVAFTTFEAADVTASSGFTVTGNLSVDGGTIKLDGNYPIGTNNTALGDAALDDASFSGEHNVAIGHEALTAATTGSSNTAVGRRSLQSDTTGNFNIAVGRDALASNTTADNNTAVGYQAGYNNNAGAITSVGHKSLYSNTTGSSNTAVGREAAYSNTSGTNNAALGRDALYSNTTSINNTAVGYQAGYSNTTSDGRNAYFGHVAGLNSTGSYNTFIGAGAGNQMTTGTKNTILGRYNGNQDGLDIRTSSNNIVLSDGDGNPRLWFDGSGNFFVPPMGAGAGSYTVKWNSSTGEVTRDSSSQRYKQNIRDSIYGLSDVLQIQSRMFEYKKEGRTDVGFVAEELNEIIPELVAKNEENQPEAVSYDRLTSVLVKAIQEQQATIEALEARIAALEAN